jgi:acetyltransferase-like isoleucine patch superfamily enzyme
MLFGVSLVRLVAWYRFRRAEAELDVGTGAQIRSLAFFPLKGGSFTLGEQSIYAGRLSMDREGAEVHIGARTYVGKSHLVVARSIRIGDDVLVSWGVTIIDHQSHSLQSSERADDVVNWLTGIKEWTHVTIKPVTIGDKVWIGFNAAILPGVTVGEGAVVGACSVVTKDVPPYTIVAGNPARVVRELDANERGAPFHDEKERD